MTYIYEVVDNSDDECYQSLGVFLLRADAISLLDGPRPPYNDCDPDAVSVEVRERKVGFHPHEYRVIASRQWVRIYDEGRDEDWESNPIHIRP